MSDREIIAAGRRMSALGLVAGTEGNVSARIPGGLRITPSSVPYEAIGETDLVTVDPRGVVTAGDRAPSSELPLHLAIYSARPDVGAIVHTHSPAAIAWSLRNEDLPGGRVHDTVRTAPAADPGSRELARVAVAALGPRAALLMAGHGVVAVAASPDEALAVAIDVENRALAR